MLKILRQNDITECGLILNHEAVVITFRRIPRDNFVCFWIRHEVVQIHNEAWNKGEPSVLYELFLDILRTRFLVFFFR